MNRNKNILVKAFDYLIDTITELVVSLFDGLLRMSDRATPSTFAVDASVLPWLLPLPIAFMTAHSLETYFVGYWEHWQALVTGFGLEGLGVLVWSRLADAIVQKNRGRLAMAVLAVVAVAYEGIIVGLNVVLAAQHGTQATMVFVLFLICLLPALSATLYGFHKHEVIHKLAIETAERKAREEEERKAAAELAEKIRQEKRQDARERAELKLKYAADTEQQELTESKPFRSKRK
jgi:hypothetical protein